MQNNNLGKLSLNFLLIFIRPIITVLFRVKFIDPSNEARNESPKLIIANNSSPLTILFLMLYLPNNPVATYFKAESKSIAQRILILFFEVIEIDILDLKSTQKVIDAISKGRSVVFLPEGPLVTGRTIGKIYESVGFIAAQTNVKITPIAINGLHRSSILSQKNTERQILFPQVTLKILPTKFTPPITKENISKQRKLSTKFIRTIMLEIYFDIGNFEGTLFDALLNSSKLHGAGTKIMSDITGDEMSYRQVILRSFLLSKLFCTEIDKEERIALLLPTSNAATVSFFACQLLGIETSMLNYTSGARELLNAIKTSDTKIIVTSKQFIEKASLEEIIYVLNRQSKIIYLEDLRLKISLGLKVQALLFSIYPMFLKIKNLKKIKPSSSAVVLYTSGSEGTPKGVVISHRNLLSNYAQIQMLIDLGVHDKIFNSLPFFHCFGLMAGMLFPLFKGTPVYQHPNPLQHQIIPELCYQKEITCLWGTPTFLKNYGKTANQFDMSKIKYVVSGAEKLSKEIYSMWNEKFGIRIFQGYGVTEASPVVSTNSPTADKFGTVGPLVPHMKYYIRPIEGFDNGGELILSGPNIMCGYLNDTQNSERIKKPITKEKGGGWYATGDIVDIDEDGFIKIVGRIKRFAKVGGEMISLSALEELANKTWPEQQHAAIAKGDSKRGETIILFTTETNANRSNLVETANQYHYSKLLIPKTIKFLKQIPVLGSGKTDYNALNTREI